jgi:hypothetical protein
MAKVYYTMLRPYIEEPAIMHHGRGIELVPAWAYIGLSPVFLET